MTKLDDTSLPPEATPRDQRRLMAGAALVSILGQPLTSTLAAENSRRAKTATLSARASSPMS